MADETTIEKRQAGELAETEYTRSGRQYRPNCDILETTEELTLMVDLPGCGPNDVDINFEQGTLIIHGRVPQRQQQESYLLQEYGVGDFHRTFQVSEAVDIDRISADCNNGVLTLHLPKVEAAKPRKIEVKAK